jgi:hypothetical protein
MPSVVLPISLTKEQWLRFYRGEITSVQATSLDGRAIRIPARVFQGFVTPDGVLGVFRVTFDDANRFVRIERLGRG